MEQENDYGDFIEKKQFIISLAIVISVAITLFLTFFLLLNNRISKLHGNVPNEQKPVFNETENNTSEDEYIIKEFDGKIGVYKNGDFQYAINIYVFTLPENDKKLLLRGIKVSSEQELNNILSSYY